MDNKKLKNDLRRKITLLKNEYTLQDLESKSEEVFSVLEITGTFNDAKTIFIYNNLSDEVATSAFIKRWKDQKDFYLPVVTENGLVFRPADCESYQESTLGIKEPLGIDFTNYNKVDLVIVPGLVFDRKMNRLGRGKGYYDCFLPNIKATKVGVCFDFQLLDSIPYDDWDVKMDMIVSENDLIW